jgi:hypothetical protein
MVRVLGCLAILSCAACAEGGEPTDYGLFPVVDGGSTGGGVAGGASGGTAGAAPGGTSGGAGGSSGGVTDGGSGGAVGGTGGVTGTMPDGSVGTDAGTPDGSVGTDAGTPDGSMGTDAGTPGGTNDASGGVPGSDAGNDSGGVALALKPKCMKKDSQLIVIGDSYINWLTHSFPWDIERESGQTWRMHAAGACSMGSGGICSIPQQFDDAIAADPDAHTVLMDGGGNDILVADPALDPAGECTNAGASKNPNCQAIVKMALDAADALMNRAVAKNIRDVVYFFYPRVPANTYLTGTDPNEILGYALPMVRSFCENAAQRTGGKLRCTFVDMTPVFEGHDEYIFPFDVHPNDVGSAAMAKEVWRVMTEKCIGQKGPKDCCES